MTVKPTVWCYLDPSRAIRAWTRGLWGCAGSSGIAGTTEELGASVNDDFRHDNWAVFTVWEYHPARWGYECVPHHKMLFGGKVTDWKRFKNECCKTNTAQMEGGPGCGDVMLSAQTTKKPRCCVPDSLEVRASQKRGSRSSSDWCGGNVVEQTHPGVTCCCIHNTGEQMGVPGMIHRNRFGDELQPLVITLRVNFQHDETWVKQTKLLSF